MHIYYKTYGELPELNDIEKVKGIVTLSRNYYNILRLKFEKDLTIKARKITSIIEFDEEYLIKVFRWCKSEINPICAFLGGIVSQESIKITGKYTLMHQWL